MAKVIIDDGTQEIPILNKFGKHICNIYIRPADIAILDRYQALMRDFDQIVAPLQNLDINADGTASFDKDWKTLKEPGTRSLLSAGNSSVPVSLKLWPLSLLTRWSGKRKRLKSAWLNI